LKFFSLEKHIGVCRKEADWNHATLLLKNYSAECLELEKSLEEKRERKILSFKGKILNFKVKKINKN
jgi:hypothetical protein